MKKYIYLLLLVVSCSKQQVNEESRVQAMERAINSPEITEFYRVTFEEAKLVKAYPLASISEKVKEIGGEQERLMEVIKNKFPEFTPDEMKVIFKRIADKTGFKFVRPMAARYPYPYDANCQNEWDDTNNNCWSAFLWSQWWHLLKGVATWAGTVDTIATFTDCTQNAEQNYYYCSGD